MTSSWNKECDRCGQPMTGWSMSYFNTDECCFACLEKERKHPDYEKAKQAEVEAVIRGDYNFPGIGLPADLRASGGAPEGLPSVHTQEER